MLPRDWTGRFVVIGSEKHRRGRSRGIGGARMETRLRIDGSIVESVTPKNCCATPVQDPRHLFPYHPIQLGDLSLSLCGGMISHVLSGRSHRKGNAAANSIVRSNYASITCVGGRTGLLETLSPGLIIGARTLKSIHSETPLLSV